MKHTETVEADLGRTELLGPLEYIFKQPLLPGLPRQVFVLTDGSVSNTHACIQEVKSNVKHARYVVLVIRLSHVQPQILAFYYSQLRNPAWKGWLIQ